MEENTAPHLRTLDRRSTEREEAAEMQTLLADAVERGVRRVLNDEQLRRDFWAAGYKELEQHAGTNVAQWLGRRIINIVITAAVAGLLAWAVMTGKTDR